MSSTTFVDFGKSKNLFGRFSRQQKKENDTNYLEWPKMVRKDDRGKIRWPSTKKLGRITIQTASAALPSKCCSCCASSENVQKSITTADRSQSKLIGTTKRYYSETPERAYVQIRLFSSKKAKRRCFNKLFLWTTSCMNSCIYVMVSKLHLSEVYLIRVSITLCVWTSPMNRFFKSWSHSDLEHSREKKSSPQIEEKIETSTCNVVVFTIISWKKINLTLS